MLNRRERIGNWLGRRAPWVYRMAHALLIAWKRLRGQARYAEERKDYRYYHEVIRLARGLAPQGGSAIDIGCGACTVLDRLGDLDRRVTLDQRYRLPIPGIESLTCDFMQYHPPAGFDLVLCLQVLEHLEDPAPFARQLFEIGRDVIISVPYRWRSGACPGHVQDPVDEGKLRTWTGRDPDESLIVADGEQRLIAVYRGMRN